MSLASANPVPEPANGSSPGLKKPEGSKKTALRLAALFLITLVIYLPGTFVLPLVDRDETYYAEVSREMNERTDYIVPYFNGKFWLEKTPLLYWEQAASFRLFGENEFAARLPDVIATALTALVIFGFCTSLYDTRTAWRAALIFLLCVEALIFGRAGIMDMPLTLFTTIATWAAWERCRGNPRNSWWWVFYVSLALASLAKGPVAILPVCGLLVYARLARIEGLHRMMKFGRGLAITLFLAGLWYGSVLYFTNGEFFHKFFGDQVWAKLSTSQQGHGATNALIYLVTLPVYLLLLIPTFLPWSFFLPAAWKRVKTEWKPGDVYLVSGILVTFVLFSLLRTKLPHYTLPAFPLIACAVAPSVSNRQMIRPGVIMVVITLIAAFLLVPLTVPYCVSKRLAASPLLKNNMDMGACGYDEPGFVWFMRGRVKSMRKMLSPDQVGIFMQESGPRFCVLKSKDLTKIPLDPEWKIETVKGFDAVHGRWIELSMVVKAE